MALCVKCSNSTLLQVPWESLQPTVEESKVVHSWLKEESSPDCALCQLVESEIRAVGEFEQEISVLIRFIKLFTKLVLLKDQAPPVEETSPSEPQDELQPATEDASPTGEIDGRDDVPRDGNSSLKMTQTVSKTNKHSLPDSKDVSVWELDSLFLEEDPDAAVDHNKLERAVASMWPVFARHDGYQNCVVCDSMNEFSLTKELDSGRLKYKLKEATQLEKEAVVKHHPPPPDPRRVTGLRLSSIVKVEFVLEKRGHWSAIRLQEFRKDEKSVRFRNRRPPNIIPGLPDILGASTSAIEESAGQSRSDPSALDVFEHDLVPMPETALRKEYRQHSKDICVFVPFQTGKRGCAREVTGNVNVEVIKLWLSQCENNHIICSQPIENSFPPGLILIDAEMMCLVPIAPDDSVPYIALSYVWGYVAQPTLTKAVLDTLACQGELRDLEIPQTIRDAIKLVQMIGYRYIWVDALCIVQGDEASRHGQISQMHEIYRHADLTIVAADGDDCSNGLPGVTAVRDRAYKHRRYELPGLCLMKVPASTKHGIQMSSWRTRGWTFQEEICSRRTLVLLPEVMFFSCASAVWREDIQLESGVTHPRSEEGLMSLTSLLHQKTPGDSKDLLLLFRDLVKQYMQRTLSRIDDMENAFAGVAGILEPLVGPAYHGIPERMFVEVIQGCWFWDTSLQRRAGFPSWSWTGWIYRQEQADVGIRPLNTASNMSQLLAFYKVGRSGIELLGQSRPGGEFLPEMDVELRDHFIPDEEDIRSRNEPLEHQSDSSSGLIAFYTSIAYLKLRTPPGDFVGLSREYRVFHPHTNKQLTSIRLNVAYVAQNGTLLPFIVVYHDPDKRSFRLMLISKKGTTAERLNVTSQGRLVREEDWKGASPKRELIFMS